MSGLLIPALTTLSTSSITSRTMTLEVHCPLFIVIRLIWNLQVLFTKTERLGLSQSLLGNQAVSQKCNSAAQKQGTPQKQCDSYSLHVDPSKPFVQLILEAHLRKLWRDKSKLIQGNGHLALRFWELLALN